MSVSSNRAPASREAARAVVQRFPVVGVPTTVEPFGTGLINDTFAITTPSGSYVLQRLHPVFSPDIHRNIAAVSAHLQAKGLVSPTLVPDGHGDLFTRDADGRPWRMLTRISGCTFDHVQDRTQARAAGSLLGRFHRALADLDHDFVGLRSGIHDTDNHLERLRAALDAHHDHRLRTEVKALAEAIFASSERLQPLSCVRTRIAHGDPKFNNIVFAGPRVPDSHHAVCWIDLDTVGPMALAWELGDAWRSWCNPLGEDDGHARFELARYESAWQGWVGEAGAMLEAEERDSLVHGLEWVTLELACRFARDALEEAYFGWDPARFAKAGEHNLLRARGQWSLHRAVIDCRRERERVLFASC